MFAYFEQLKYSLKKNLVLILDMLASKFLYCFRPDSDNVEKACELSRQLRDGGASEMSRMVVFIEPIPAKNVGGDQTRWCWYWLH